MKIFRIVVATLLASACGDGAKDGSAGPAKPARQEPAERETPSESSSTVSGSDVVPLNPGDIRKIDLLLMIDNSTSMSDKQQILSTALPDLMNRFVNPVCVDAQGNQYTPPLEGSSTCPAGQSQEFQPIEDIHVGIVSSSLGDSGANVACPEQGFPRYRADGIDMAHLLGSLERSHAASNAQGFLEWHAGASNATDFNRDFQQMARDVGESGCGWEAQLESWYRFLVDPVPFQGLARAQCPGSTSSAHNCVQRATGSDNRFLLDEVLLDQRDAFLRPDSLVAIVMLSDENDCSLQLGGQTWTVLNIEDTRPMFKGSSACADDPNAKCCYSCPLGPPAGCPLDPACTEDAARPNRLAPELDGQNLRCFDQKRRFGIDFLYPTARYVNALTEAELCWSANDLSLAGCDPRDILPNPLFVGGREPAQVFLSGIIGVPWQALAAGGAVAGATSTAPRAARFKTYEELTRDGVWAQILGEPGVAWQAGEGAQPEVHGSPGVPPLLPQMVESPSLRVGVLAGNPLNGRDYDTTQGTATQTGDPPRADDLQYACLFPLATPRDCAALDPDADNCDCYPGVLDRPLCEQTPGVSAPGTTQYWGKAYPGLRELQVLKDYGERTGNSVVASICALNVTDASSPMFGYRPAMAAMVERMKTQLVASP